MAKEFSFDIVSSVDIQEADNAFQQTKKEISQRYDLKDSGSSISLDKNNKVVEVVAPSEFVAGQVIDVFQSKLIKRGIELSALKWGKATSASGMSVRQAASIIDGIDKETAGKINKDIKASKLKVKSSIDGDKLRITSASKDALQDVISLVKANDYGQPLQFVNYR